jgi:dnd system-associated protein 4
MRGIRRSEQFEDMVRMLAEAQHPEAGRSIFPTMRELMFFAAVLGFEHDRKRPLQAQTNEIDGRTFSGSAQALDLLYLIALADDRNVDVLREENDEKMIEIFEQYAQGGFEIIAGWLREKPEDLNGDQALLSGLSRNGFLSAPSDVDKVIENVSF